MTNKTEIYYFESEEFQNLKNLKDVLRDIGEKTVTRKNMDEELREFADEKNLEWSEIMERESYNLDDGISVEYMETDTGVFVISDSNILHQNSKSIVSRS